MKKSTNKKLKKIYRFFYKRIDLFLFHFQNARHTGFISDVHDTRVEMKKLITQIDLLKSQFPEKVFSKEEGRKLKELFRRMGKLREVQVNLKILSQRFSADFRILDFRHHLEQHEKKCLRNFILEAYAFDQEICDRILSEMKLVLKRVDQDRFVKLSKKYIKKKSERIKDLQPGMNDISNAHLVRKHLKSIAVVQTMIYLLRPDKETLTALTELNRNEKIIGAWHDKMVFLDSLEKYLEEIGNPPDQMLMPIYDLKNEITKECEEMFQRFSGGSLS